MSPRNKCVNSLDSCFYVAITVCPLKIIIIHKGYGCICICMKSEHRKVSAFCRQLKFVFDINCHKFDAFHELLNIDESVRSCHGHHSAKQFIRKKPVRIGYKMWILCVVDRHPYNLSIYSGKGDKKTRELGSRVVMSVLQPVENADQHVLFFVNFFTSHTLLTELSDKGIRALQA